MVVDKDFAQACSRGVFPPIFHKFRDRGLYCLRFQINFKWVYVIVDERIPCFKGTKNPVFSHCKRVDEIWVQLVEKAFAKLNGCYGNLISGYVEEGVQELTGMPPNKILLRDESSRLFPHQQVKDLAQYVNKPFKQLSEEDVVWNLLLNAYSERSLLSGSIRGYCKMGQLLMDDLETGLVFDQAYPVLDAMNFDNFNEFQQ